MFSEASHLFRQSRATKKKPDVVEELDFHDPKSCGKHQTLIIKII